MMTTKLLDETQMMRDCLPVGCPRKALNPDAVRGVAGTCTREVCAVDTAPRNSLSDVEFLYLQLRRGQSVGNDFDSRGQLCKVFLLAMKHLNITLPFSLTDEQYNVIERDTHEYHDPAPVTHPPV